MAQYPSSPSQNNISQFNSNISNLPASSPMRYNNNNIFSQTTAPGTPLHRNGFTGNANGNMATGGIMVGMNGINAHGSMGGANGTNMNINAGANPQQNSPSQITNLHGKSNGELSEGNGKFLPNPPVVSNPVSINVNNNLLPTQNANLNIGSRNDALNGASLTTTTTKNNNKQNMNANTNVSNTTVNTPATQQVGQTPGNKGRIKWDNDDRFEHGYLDSKLRQAFAEHQGASWKDISITFRRLVLQETNIKIEISADLCRQRYTRINSRPVDLTDKEVVMKLVMLDHNNNRFAWKEWAEENLKPNPNKTPVDNRPIDGDRVKNAYHQLKGALDHYKKDRKMPGRTTLPPPAQEVIIEVAHKQLGIEVPKPKTSNSGNKASNTVLPGGLAINPTPSTPKKSPKYQKRKGSKKNSEEEKNLGVNSGNKTPMGNVQPLMNTMTPSPNYPQMYGMYNTSGGGTPINNGMPNNFVSPNPQFGMNMMNGPTASPLGRYNNYSQSMGANQMPYNYGVSPHPAMMSPNPTYGFNNNPSLMSPMNVNGGGMMINSNPMLTPNRKNSLHKQPPANNPMVPNVNPHLMSSPTSNNHQNSQKGFPTQNMNMQPQSSTGNFPATNTGANMNQAPQTPKSYFPYRQTPSSQNLPQQNIMPPNLQQNPVGPYPPFNSKALYTTQFMNHNQNSSPFSGKQELTPAKDTNTLQTPSNKKIKLSPTATPNMSHSPVLQENKVDHDSPKPPPPIDTKGGNSTPFQMSPYTPYTPTVTTASINPSPQPSTSNVSSVQPFPSTSSMVNKDDNTTSVVHTPSHKFLSGDTSSQNNSSVFNPLGPSIDAFGNDCPDKLGTQHTAFEADTSTKMNKPNQDPKISSGNENSGTFNDADTVNTEPNSTTLSPQVYVHQELNKSDTPTSLLGKRKEEDKPCREELEKENTHEGQFSSYNTLSGTTSTMATNFCNPISTGDVNLKVENTKSEN